MCFYDLSPTDHAAPRVWPLGYKTQMTHLLAPIPVRTAGIGSSRARPMARPEGEAVGAAH
jgi:hypothetical protein